MSQIAHTLALVFVASVWGSMLFFAAAVAPSVFRFLEPAMAGKFIRRLFPIYYLFLGVLSALATLMLIFMLPAALLEWLLLLAVTLGFGVARQIMMPKINALRDAANTGDTKAEVGFKRWHQASVLLNLVQMLVILYVLIRMIH